MDAAKYKYDLEMFFDSSHGPFAEQKKAQIASRDDIKDSLRVYYPLRSHLQEFRIVAILPSAQFDSIVECRLTCTTLQDCPPYEALSYVWGKPDFTQKILVDHKPFLITPNLEIALRHLRYSDRERMLWVDAICIDQSNPDERSEQVGYMRKIYSHCSTDLFWLGVDSPRRQRGIEILKTLGSFNVKELGWKSYGIWQDQQENWKVNRDDLSRMMEVLRTPEIWDRAWAVQEISCAPKVQLVSGQSTMDWDVVEKIIGSDSHYTDAFHAPFSHHTSPITDRVFRKAKIVKTQRQNFRELQQGGESTLFDVLARYRFHKSTDPRDKIYALLGLVSDSVGVEVDYNSSTRDVYTKVAQYLVNSHANLDIICQSQWALSNNPDRISDLPSWVPDFNAPGNGTFLFAQRSIYSAGNPSCSTPCRISARGELKLDGVGLGQITKTGDPKHKRPLPWSDLVILCMEAYLQGQEAYCERETAYVTGEPLIQACWRTFVADCKIYPTERLSNLDIERNNSIFCNLQDNAMGPNELEGELNRIDPMTRHALCKMVENWRFVTTNNGLFAMAPLHAEEGDELAILHGAKVPLLLRKVEKADDEPGDQTFQVIGGSYVHGFMDGEAQIWAEEGRLKAQEFTLA